MRNPPGSARRAISSMLAYVFMAMLASAQLRISEFQAANLDDLEDEEGQSSDWIEIHNLGGEEISLTGWFLTDDPDNLTKWRFPATLSLHPDAYLVVFASEKDRHTQQNIFQRSPIKSTHTNFKLSRRGEYLALIRPDGQTVEHELAPSYPPQVGNTSYGLNAEGQDLYYVEATPGEANRGGATSIGPIIAAVTNLPGTPHLDEVREMAICAEVTSPHQEVTEVTMFHRVMFQREIETRMHDDGVTPDQEAGDGVYTAAINLVSIFGSRIKPGEMIRWRVEATDAGGKVQRLPLYHDPHDSDQYFGTVADSASWESSNLPILHWFVENPQAAATAQGTTCSVFYEGEFYDNVRFDIHGQSTRSFPKQAYDVDFNSGHRFQYQQDEDRVKDVNILTNWADKSKVRNTIAYGIQAEMGVPAHFAFPIRIEQNGEFHSTADMVEDGDDLYLKRVGLRADGALYKMYNTFDSTNGAQKKSRKWEGDRDLRDFIAGLAEGTLQEKKAFTYDHVNIAGMVNFMAAKAIYNNTDFGHKNYYAYRDAGDSDEWTFLPWDVDISLGRRWTSSETYFRDAMEARNSVTLGTKNRLLSTLFADPDFVRMFYRRLRTLMDRYYGEPGGTLEDSWFMDKLSELAEAIDPEGVVSDADLDYEKWGSWGNRNDTRAALARIRDEFIPLRRQYLYGLKEVPERQRSNPTVKFDQVVFRSESGHPAEEYLVLKSSAGEALDISDWAITGAVDYTFRPGTVIPDSATIFSPHAGKIHVVADSKAFRARPVSPKGGEALLLQGDYRGQLSAQGGKLILRDGEGNVIAEHSYGGDPSGPQVGLRVTEIMYRPLAGGSGSPHSRSAFEYIELKNVSDSSLSLAGVHFSDGIEFAFSDEATLEAGALGVLVKNQEAFRSRYGADPLILGTFAGRLNNDGESIQLRDADGENILAFQYEGSWSELADERGHSLEIIDDAAHFDAWNLRESWRASPEVMGSPGAPNQPAMAVPPDGGGVEDYAAWSQEQFSPEELSDPSASGPGGDANGDGMVNLLAYAWNIDPHAPVKASHLPTGAFTRMAAGLRFRRRAGAVDLRYLLERARDLQSWTLADDAVEQGQPSQLGDGTELVTLISPRAADGPEGYIRLRVELVP